METIFQYVFFFLVGIIQDIFITYYYHVIAKEYVWKSAVVSMFVTLVNLLILYKILTGIEDQAIGIILVYAFGNGVGTAMTIKRHRIKSLVFEKVFSK